MANGAKTRLLERAMALPLARDEDFFGGRKAPSDARPEHLRIINDSALRARLIGANIAVGLQSPKGPQRIASIIRVYPNFDAPGLSAPPTNGSAGPSRTKAGASLQPSIEELEQLITRVRAVEGHVAREMNMAIDAEIERLRRKLGEATPEQIEDAHSALGAALDRRRAMSTEIRREAYRRIERDHEFPPRVYIRLLAE